MARPSQGVDLALLKAGIEEIKSSGVRGMSVRGVCARADVSIRMLNYYFGTKTNFVRLVLTYTYEQFLNAVQASLLEGGSPLDKISRVIRVSAAHAVQNQEMAQRLWMDANAGEPLVLEMMNKNSHEHTKLLLALFREAQEQGMLRKDIPAMQMFMAILPGVFLPCVWGDNLHPHLRQMFPAAEWTASTDDIIDLAAQNFQCLLEGYKAQYEACPTTDAPLRRGIASTHARGRKISQRSPAESQST